MTFACPSDGSTGSRVGELGGRGEAHVKDAGTTACHVNPTRDGVLLEGWHSCSGPSAMGWTGVQRVLQPCSHTKCLCKEGIG